MEISKSKVQLEMTETTTKTAEISVEEILDIVWEELERSLDSFTLYDEKPSIDYSDNGDSFEVYLHGIDDYQESDVIIEEVGISVDKKLGEYIKEMANKARLPQNEDEVTDEPTKKAPAMKRPADYIGEEGENGTL